MISLPSFIQAKIGKPQRMGVPRRKMIIDTDAGGDDVHALMCALTLAKENGIEVIGFTCINGNSQIKDGVKNIAIVQKLCGTTVPVYAGCDRTLRQRVTLSSGFFKEDGLSGHQQKYIQELALTEFPLQKEHAVDFIIESADKYKDELVIVVIGPMTNIACCLIKSDHFELDVGQIITLSGNILGLGVMNNGVAEYNVFTDPEAAHLVLKVLHNKLAVIPFESVVSIDHETVNQTFEHEETQKGRFIKEVNQGMKDNNQRYDIQDPLAVALALYPDIVTEFVEKQAQVILEGEGRGMLNIDWFHEVDNGNNILFILKVDEKRLLQVMHRIVLE